MLDNTNKTCKKAFTLVTSLLLATTLLFGCSNLKGYGVIEDSDKITKEKSYGNENENEQAEIDYGNSIIDACDTSPTDTDDAYMIPPCATHNIA
jgi:hypothetical protein